MNSKNVQRIIDALRHFKLSSVTIEKELSEWEAPLDRQIFRAKVCPSIIACWSVRGAKASPTTKHVTSSWSD